MEYACYETENGEYIWTNKPNSNWQLVTDIKSQNEAKATSLNSDRFIREINNDGTITLIDKENNYNIKYTKEDGFVAYNNGKEVYHIYPDGMTSVKKPDGESVILNRIMSIEGMSSNMSLTDTNGNNYDIKNGFAEISTNSNTDSYDSNSRFVVKDMYDNSKVIIDRENNYTIYENNGDYYVENEQGKEIYHIYPNGTTNFKTADGNIIVSDVNMSISDISKDMSITDREGRIYTINNGFVEEVSDYSKYPRFYSTMENKNNLIIDRENNLKIYDYKEQGLVAYNKEGEEVYHIYADGTTNIKTNLGYSFMTDKPITIMDFNKDMTIELNNGEVYQFKDGKVITYKNSSGIKHYIYGENGDYYSFYEGKEDSKFYYHDGFFYKFSDGKNTQIYYKDQYRLLLLDEDGTYRFIENDEERMGTYTFDDDLGFVLTDDNNNQEFYDKYGVINKTIDSNGVVCDYDYKNDSQKVTKLNNIVSVSKINHIEYDEEEYEKIIHTLKDIEERNVVEKINNNCSFIEEMIDCLPDRFWMGSINNNKNTIDEHLLLISKLNEMINYSLLAYQSCDESLRDQLYKLVDSLFEDGKSSSMFKSEINNYIENNDGILSFNNSTNFNKLSTIIRILDDNKNNEIISGDDLKKFLAKCNIKEMDSIIATKEVTKINGVDFDVYQIIDIDTLNEKGFNKYVKECNEVLSNVDEEVLKYISNTGGSIIYCSNYSVAPDFYDKHYAGLAYPEHLYALSVYNEPTAWDTEAVLHEMGHTLDHCIYLNQTGYYGSTTYAGYDYSNIPNEINTRELAHKEYGAYYPDYVYMDDYSNENDYSACEFFAESFRNYYTLDEEKRERFAATIPETFKFFDAIEEWVGEQK